MSTPPDQFVTPDQMSALSGVQAAKLVAILRLAQPLLGTSQEQPHDLPVELASARGQYATVDRLIRFRLGPADDMELELLFPNDEIDLMAVGLGAIADFIDGPAFRPPTELFGSETAQMVTSIVGELRDRAVALLATRRPLTAELPGAITYSFDDSD